MRIGLETKVEPDNVFQVVGRDGGNGGGREQRGGGRVQGETIQGVIISKSSHLTVLYIHFIFFFAAKQFMFCSCRGFVSNC